MNDGLQMSMCQRAGYDAYWQGVPRDRNPWPRGDVTYQHWHQGWDAAETEIMTAPPTVPMDEVFAVIGEPIA